MQTFLEVCSTLSYTQAARNLEITQPAVSQQIKQLENYYHAPLFLYSGRKLSLTEAGKIIYMYASSAAHDDSLLEQQIDRLEGADWRISIGVTVTAGEYVLAPALAKFLLQRDEAVLNVREGDTRSLLAKVNDGSLDIALVEGFFDKGSYSWQECSREDFVCLCSPKHSFKHKPRKLSDVLGERLIVREDGSGTREALVRTLESENQSLDDFNICATVTSLDIIKQLVEGDCGITFMYRTAATHEIEAGKLQVVELEDMKASHDFTFVWRAGGMYEAEFHDLAKQLRDLI